MLHRSDIADVELRFQPGLIWPVIAFSAKIKSWPFNTPPPEEYTRHHLKSASEKTYESYTVELEIIGNEPIGNTPCFLSFCVCRSASTNTDVW